MQYQPNKALTQWLNRCIPMEDNTMYYPPYGLIIFTLKLAQTVQYMNGI